MKGPAVRLRSAVALVGRFPVLAGVDLDVGRGEVVLLQGGNGAGKTSLLRVCAGLLPVVAGTAEVLGCDLVADRRAARRRTALYGHATSLYDDLSAVDNVRFAAQAARAPRRRVDEAMATMGLTGRLRDAPVASLSAGQRRRTALAILLARTADLWLLDEPHAGLDAAHRDLLDTLIHEAAARGTTVLVASHELDRAEALAHRTVIVAGGAVTSADTDQTRPAAPLALPTTRRESRSRRVGPTGRAVGEARPRRLAPTSPATTRESADVG